MCSKLCPEDFLKYAKCYFFTSLLLFSNTNFQAKSEHQEPSLIVSEGKISPDDVYQAPKAEIDYKQILDPNRQYRQSFTREFPNQHKLEQKKVFINGKFNLEDFKPSLPLNGKLIRNPKRDWEPTTKSIFQQTVKQSENEYDCILRCRKSGLM